MKIKLSFSLLMFLFLFSCSKESQNPELQKAVDDPTAQIMEEIETRLDIDTDFNTKRCQCQPIDWVTVTNVTSTSATINWGYPKLCGSYFIMIRNITLGTYTYASFVPGYSYNLTHLDPCSDYEIGVGHIGSDCVAIPRKTYFTTDCCSPGSNNSSELYIQYVTLTSAQHPGVWSAVPSPGYIDKTSVELDVPANTTLTFTAAGMCFSGTWTSTVYAKLWIDYNGDGTFAGSELAYSYSNGPFNPGGTSSCLDIAMPNFTTPNFNACNITARYIISTDPISGPCVTVNRGQVMDFGVDLGTCSDL